MIVLGANDFDRQLSTGFAQKGFWRELFFARPALTPIQRDV